jgi:hypothetical protein
MTGVRTLENNCLPATSDVATIFDDAEADGLPVLKD